MQQTNQDDTNIRTLFNTGTNEEFIYSPVESSGTNEEFIYSLIESSVRFN